MDLTVMAMDAKSFMDQSQRVKDAILTCTANSSSGGGNDFVVGAVTTASGGSWPDSGYNWYVPGWAYHPEDKYRTAFRIAKALMAKGSIKVTSVKQYSDLIEEIVAAI